MAIVDMDGFENGAINISGTAGVASVGTGRDGLGLAARGGMNASIVKYFNPGSDTVFFHMGWYWTTEMVGNSLQNFFGNFRSDNGGTSQIGLNCDGAGHMRLLRGDGFGTQILVSSYAFPFTSAWHSIEGKLKVADSGGEVIIKVDGVEIINYVGDTRNGGTSTKLDQWECRPNGFSSNLVDDWMLNDTTGSANNTWTGEVSIQGLRPTGNGAFSDLVGSDGNSVDNYQLVDEYPYNITDYVSSLTTGAKDTYDFSNLAKTGTVIAVQATAYASKSEAGPKFFRIVQRGASGGLVETADLPLSTTFLPVPGPIWLTDGDGSPWTKARVDASSSGSR